MLLRPQIEIISPLRRQESNGAWLQHLGVRVCNHACGSANHPRSARALGRLAIAPEATEAPWVNE